MGRLLKIHYFVVGQSQVLQSIRPSGEFSLQNALILATERLQVIPSYGHREASRDSVIAVVRSIKC